MCLISGSFLMIHSPIDKKIPPIHEDTKTPVINMNTWNAERSIVENFSVIGLHMCSPHCARQWRVHKGERGTIEVMNPKPNTCNHQMCLNSCTSCVQLLPFACDIQACTHITNRCTCVGALHETQRERSKPAAGSTAEFVSNTSEI